VDARCRAGGFEVIFAPACEKSTLQRCSAPVNPQSLPVSDSRGLNESGRGCPHRTSYCSGQANGPPNISRRRTFSWLLRAHHATSCHLGRWCAGGSSGQPAALVSAAQQQSLCTRHSSKYQDLLKFAAPRRRTLALCSASDVLALKCWGHGGLMQVRS
jgi:hypothetical protein